MRRFALPLMFLFVAACTAETSSPAVADHFEVVQAPAKGTPGRALDSLVIVRLIDADGHSMPGVSVSWSVLTGNGSLSAVTDATNSEGLAVAAWTMGGTPGENTLRVLAGGGPTRDVSVDARGLEGVEIAVASNAACILTAAGAVWCWGDGVLDYPGNRFNYGPRPVLVDSGHVFRSIVAGDQHFCALTEAGAAWCWGSPIYGRVGRGDTVSAPFTPGPVVGGHSFTQLSAADWGVLAVDGTGALWRWGSTRESNAEVPISVPEDVSVPGVIFTKVFAGYIHMCALEADGTAWCRGHGDVGQTGDSLHRTDRAVFFPLPTTTKFGSIAIGWHFSCGVALAGTMWCWGESIFSPNISLSVSWNPYQVEGSGFGSAIANYRTLVATSGGGLSAASDDSYSPTVAGLPSTTLTPLVGASNGVTRVSVRDQTLCLLRGGAVMCAGEVPGYGTAASPIGIPAP